MEQGGEANGKMDTLEVWRGAKRTDAVEKSRLKRDREVVPGKRNLTSINRAGPGEKIRQKHRGGKRGGVWRLPGKKGRKERRLLGWDNEL